MSVHTIELEDAKDHLAELIDQAARGDEVVLTRDSEPVAKLVPYDQRRQGPRAGSAKGLITIRDDFDDPLEDFKTLTLADLIERYPIEGATDE